MITLFTYRVFLRSTETGERNIDELRNARGPNSKNKPAVISDQSSHQKESCSKVISFTFYTLISFHRNNIYYYYFRLTAVFSRWTWVSWSFFGSSLSGCSETEPLEISGTGFYESDVLPATQPSVSKHWREHKALTLTSSLASSFPYPPPEFLRNMRCSLYAGSPTPVSM